MADADEAFYRDVVRAGYRGPYLGKLAADVAGGTIDLEELNDPAFRTTKPRRDCSPFPVSARTRRRT